VTRSGRCGEFANCFTFLCRCLGYDARYIYSTSDHVWTEVYNHSKKRWIHVDPSENVFDSPLMYEAGWKRKLEYVLAFAHDDVQDVTWRYSSDHEALKQRRKSCSEGELIKAIVALRGKRQAKVTPARKKFLTLRTFAELAELLIVRQPTNDELKGRSSGSLSWRLQRGEANESTNHVISLTDDEKRAKKFSLRYSCARDIYERSTETVTGWSSLTFSSTNIFRKVEHDHKMAYISRTEGSPAGELRFSFDFSNLTIKSLDVKFDTKTFSSGQVSLEFLDASDKVVAKSQLINASKFSIRCRQSLSDKDFPFEVSAEFH
jgi:peptide-N4-(N-acetyl-beta-glucosaminyl)asparagine amidase